MDFNLQLTIYFARRVLMGNKMLVTKRGPALRLHNLKAKHTHAHRHNNASSIFKTLISINRIDYEHPLSRKVMFD